MSGPNEPTSAVTRPASSRRGLITAVGLLALGAVVILVAAGRTWLTATWVVPDFPAVRVQRTGAEAAPVVRAAAFVILAGVLALLATKRRGRLVVGCLVVLASVGSLVGCVLFWWLRGTNADAALARAASDPTLTVHATSVATSGWPVVAVLGSLVAGAGGLLVVVRGGRWPAMGRRYDAPAKRTADDDPWSALDRGEDPTVPERDPRASG